MTDQIVSSISERYIELFERITGESFQKANASDILKRVENNITSFLKNYYRNKKN